ncbi:MAG: hypothetical protein D6741_00635, partial [Planctomycetota bacterium]
MASTFRRRDRRVTRGRRAHATAKPKVRQENDSFPIIEEAILTAFPARGSRKKTVNTHDPTHCTCFADQAEDRLCEVIDHRNIGEAIYRLRLRWPTFADKALPGQFVMVRIPHSTDPLLGRAFAIYDLVASPEGDCVDIVYMTLGRMTAMLPEVRPGTRLRVWGPLGNGFRLPQAKHLVLVAGGIGHTPFLMLAKAALGRAEYARGTYHAPQAE